MDADASQATITKRPFCTPLRYYPGRPNCQPTANRVFSRARFMLLFQDVKQRGKNEGMVQVRLVLQLTRVVCCVARPVTVPVARILAAGYEAGVVHDGRGASRSVPVCM